MKKSTTTSQRSQFSAKTLSTFLNNGWFISIRSFPSHNQNQILLGWGEGKWSSEPNGCSLYAPDFHLKADKPWWTTPHWDLVDRDLFCSIVLSGVETNVNDNDQGFQWVEPNLGLFNRLWEEIQTGFKMRRVKKAVPVLFSRAQKDMNRLRVHRVLTNLIRAPEGLFVYGFWNSSEKGQLGAKEGILGATPEILFKSDTGREVETVALAGTRAKAAGAAEELLSDRKERHEHQLVIDDLYETLIRYGTVQVESTGVVELPSLIHLKTEISARLNRDFSFEELVRLLHPTPALGVSPRVLGFDEIRRWEEPGMRSRFGAPFGVSYDGRMICLVAIRNIQWHDDQVILGSGCGVVPESQLEREWEELRIKRESVKRMLKV